MSFYAFQTPVLEMYLNKALILAILNISICFSCRYSNEISPRVSEWRLQVPLGGSELLKCLNF